MMILSMRFRSRKTAAEQEQLSDASLPLFRSLDGLEQKYYVRDRETGEVGGVYLWTDAARLRDYLDGPIVKAIPHRFDVPGQVRTEILEVAGSLANAPVANGAVLSSVRFASRKTPDELRALSAASLPGYRGLEGLLQAYRVRDPETGRVGGIYAWSDETALKNNLDGPVRGIPETFDAEGPVDVEILDVSRVLHS